MKARVLRVFYNKQHWINYTYVDVAKYHDDHTSYSKEVLYTPMMEIRLFKNDNTLEDETVNTIASPEIIKEYTGFDIFRPDMSRDYSYSFENRWLRDIIIEFEWVEGVYPYGDVCNHWEMMTVNKRRSSVKWYERYESTNDRLLHEDYIISEKIRFPNIINIVEEMITL